MYVYICIFIHVYVCIYIQIPIIYCEIYLQTYRHDMTYSVLKVPSNPKPTNPSAPIYCGQTAGWINMVLGAEVGFSPGDFVLDGDPARSPKKGAEPPPQFRPISIVAKRLDASRRHLVPGGRPRPRQHCVTWGPSSPSPKRGQSPLNFPIFIVSKRLDASRCHFL